VGWDRERGTSQLTDNSTHGTYDHHGPQQYSHSFHFEGIMPSENRYYHSHSDGRCCLRIEREVNWDTWALQISRSAAGIVAGLVVVPERTREGVWKRVGRYDTGASNYTEIPVDTSREYYKVRTEVTVVFELDMLTATLIVLSFWYSQFHGSTYYPIDSFFEARYDASQNLLGHLSLPNYHTSQGLVRDSTSSIIARSSRSCSNLLSILSSLSTK
jgi:hypothetical protein